MENFEMWLDSFKRGVKYNVDREEKAREELTTLYRVLLLQNEQFKNEIEDLKSRLED